VIYLPTFDLVSVVNDFRQPEDRRHRQRQREEIRTIARWKSGLLPLEVFAMRVNWDTQRISPCISLTFAFHMSPEDGLENTFRDNLQSHGVNLMKMRTTQHTFSSRDSQCQRHCHLCVPPPLTSYHSYAVYVGVEMAFTNTDANEHH
jgi:hypothetical protein